MRQDLDTLRELASLLRASLATIEDALAIASESDTAPCPGIKGRCATPTGRRKRPTPCFGTVSSRWCFGCGSSVSRCEEHGGSRGATAALHRHAQACDGYKVVADVAETTVGREMAEVAGLDEAELPVGRPKLMGADEEQPRLGLQTTPTLENHEKPVSNRGDGSP